MKTIIARWTVAKSFLPSLLPLLNALQAGSRAEPGNITYDYYQDPNAPEKILIYEEYKSDEAIEAHRSTTHFQEIAMKQILPHLEDRSVRVF